MQKTLFGALREHHQNWYTLSLLYQSETSKKIYGSSIPISDNNYKSTHVIIRWSHAKHLMIFKCLVTDDVYKSTKIASICSLAPWWNSK